MAELEEALKSAKENIVEVAPVPDAATSEEVGNIFNLVTSLM